MRVLFGALRKELIKDCEELNDGVECCITALIGTVPAATKADLPASASGTSRPISPDLLQPKVSIPEEAELQGNSTNSVQRCRLRVDQSPSSRVARHRRSVSPRGVEALARTPSTTTGCTACVLSSTRTCCDRTRSF